MAELLGIVAGGAGLASLAVQLGESSTKLKRIYKSYREAPQLLGHLSDEIETFVLLLHNLERQRQQHDRIDRAVMDRCVQSFARAVMQVNAAVTKFKLASLKSEFRGRVLTALGKTDLLQLRDELERAKSSLMLACQIYSWSCRGKDIQVLEQINEATTQILGQFGSSGGSDSKTQHLLIPPDSNDITGTRTVPSIGVSKHQWSRLSAEKVVFEIVSPDRKGFRPHGQGKRSHQNWRMRFSPWFTARVWEISIGIAQSGFNLNLRTCNFVPPNALIFEACRGGSITEVQTLFQKGQASPFDCSYTAGNWPSGDTVLSAAAMSGNLQLCRYLVDIAGFPVCPDKTNDALNTYTASPSLHKVDSMETVEMYRLLVQQPSWDIEDLINFRKGCPWWWACPNVACIRFVRDECSLAFSELSWETQVKIAITNSGHDTVKMPQIFLEMLGSSSVNSHIAQAHDDRGLTAAHMMAEKLTWTGSAGGLGTWIDFTRQLLVHGADIHQKDNAGDTPFMYLLQHACNMPLDPMRVVSAWVKILKKLDVNLEVYGWRESAVWKDRYPDGIDGYSHKVISWTYGGRCRDWTLNHLFVEGVPVFKLVSAPGTWPAANTLTCETICWYPDEEDAPDGSCHWSQVATVKLYSKQRSLEEWYRQDDFSRMLSDELNDTQDDCGAVMRMIQTSSGIGHPRRRYSQPTSRGTWRVVKTKHRWLPRCHICLEDNRLKFPMERRCFELLGSELVQDQSSYHDRIKRQMLRFEARFSNLEQLRSLPYAAYHPDWQPQ